MQNNLLPVPSKERLCEAFVGRSLQDVPVPSAILDVSKIKHSCRLMLEAVKELGLDFRAHVKTHKTLELTRLQVGENSKDVRLIASTLAEIESLVPLLKDYQSKGAKVNVLYGIPPGPSKIPRLVDVAKQLGPGTVTLMIDNATQLFSVRRFKQEAGFPALLFVKADSGYHRAGLPPGSDQMTELILAVGQAETEGDLHLTGFYSHNSLSYGGNSPDEAMTMLNHEIEICRTAASYLVPKTRVQPLTISVGATPTSISIQNIQPSSPFAKHTSPSPAARTLADNLRALKAATPSVFAVEVHAGVYPVFDLQQVAATSRAFPSALAAYRTQALTVLAEVVSVYPTRTSSPEALVSAGTVALSREPCKSYPGWGIVTPWGFDPAVYAESDTVDAQKRLIVKRVSQEHGIVGWEDEEGKPQLPQGVEVGRRVRLWVNHACITSAAYAYYLVVDGEKGSGDVVVEDVWVRFQGW